MKLSSFMIADLLPQVSEPVTTNVEVPSPEMPPTATPLPSNIVTTNSSVKQIRSKSTNSDVSLPSPSSSGTNIENFSPSTRMYGWTTGAHLPFITAGDPDCPPLGRKQKRIYLCQRCLNHGREIPRKHHKPDCLFSNCTCEDCVMVDERRKLNSAINEERSREQTCESPLDTNRTATGNNKDRVPHCQRCKGHGKDRLLKGHKSKCEHKECTCTNCDLVKKRRELMADQIKLRRKQKKHKEDHKQQQQHIQLQQQLHLAAAASCFCQPSVECNSLYRPELAGLAFAAGQLCNGSSAVHSNHPLCQPSVFPPANMISHQSAYSLPTACIRHIQTQSNMLHETRMQQLQAAAIVHRQQQQRQSHGLFLPTIAAEQLPSLI